MKRNIIKFISVLMVCVLSCTFLPFCASAATALTEAESNDSYGSANEISLNGSITANLVTSSDTDFFNITPKKNGRLVISFNHTFVDSNRGWIVTVYMRNENGTYSELMSKDIYLSSSQKVDFSPIGVKAGTLYCVKVVTYKNSAYTFHTSAEYSISNSFTATENYEKEFNDSYETASEIPANTEMSACLMKSSDTDFFKIVANKSDKLDITFNHTFTDSNCGWIVTVYKRNENGTYSQLASKTIYLRDSQYVNFDSINATAGDLYCVKVVTYKNSAYTFHTSAEYSITCSFTSSGLPHTHSYGSEWKSDANYHWHKCTCGEISSKAIHTFNAGEITKSATETETGIKTYKCTVCGYEKTETIPVIGSSDTGDSSSIFSVIVNIFGYIISFFVMIFPYIIGIFG